eukprot:jgi/Mesen1/9539/ME000064S08886
MACTPAAQFWALALSPGSLHFVDTADNFKQVEEAFRRAVVVGLDAEWKPVISSSSRRKGGGGGGGGGGHASSPSPRVSILQVACRLGPSSREVAASASPVDGVNNFSAGLCSQKNGESSALLCSVKGTQEIDLGGTGREGGNGGALALAQLSYRGTLEREKAGDGDDQSEAGAGAGASSTGTGGDAGVTGDGGGGQQGSEVNVVFVLDMLALTPGVFAGPLKELLRSPAVLKLGYGLRDDMRHLAASHPGGDAKGCFDVVEPYVDVGRLYRRLHLNLTPDAQHQPGGAARRDRARAFVMTGGLSAVAEAVLGSPLDKELQCSNWEDRPLTAGQLAYAAADVCCLLSIFDAFCRSAQSPPAPGSPRATWPSLSSSPPFSFSDLTLAGVTLDPGRWSGKLRAVAARGAALRRAVAGFKVSGASKAESGAGADGEGDGDDNDDDDNDKDDDHGAGAILAPRAPPPPRLQALPSPAHLRPAHSLPLQPQQPQQQQQQQQQQGTEREEVEKQEPRCRLGSAGQGPGVGPRAREEGGAARRTEGRRVIEVFQLSISEGQLLSRCIRCNGEFSPAPLDAELATARAPPSQVVPPCVLESVAQFWQCSACNHLYWEGSQYDRAVSQFVSICKLGPNGNA